MIMVYQIYHQFIIVNIMIIIMNNFNLLIKVVNFIY